MNLRRLVALCLIALAGRGVAVGDDGVTIGRHSPGPGGATALHAHVDLAQPVGLEPSVFPGFDGYATGAFGFSNTQINEPDEDLFMLALTADISAVLLELGGTLVVNDGLHVMAVGDAMHFGQPFFDYHTIFQLPTGGSGHARMVARDASGAYTDSEEFVIAFVAVNPACPADVGSQGGVQGADGVLNNNDFIAFIELFFAARARADVGSQGGVVPGDGAFDNNDFIVFIDAFFGGCG